MDNPKNRAI